MSHKFPVCWVLLLFTSFIFLNGCKGIDLESKWRDRDVVVDAGDDEWKDCRQYFEDGTTIGIYNDESYVYLCFTTTAKRVQTELVKQGFVVWFNQGESKKKELGIRYPVVVKTAPGGPPTIQGNPDQGAPPGGESQMPPPSSQNGVNANVNQVSVEELKVLTSEKDMGKTFTLDEAAELDIFARIANDSTGKIIYELKMPLKKTEHSPYAAVPSSTNSIGVGFMLYSDPNSTSMSDKMNGFDRNMDSGMGGGGMGGGGAMEKTKLKIWTNITLSSNSLEPAAQTPLND